MSDTNNRSGADAFSDLSLSGMNKYSERNAEAHRVERANELDERIREFASRDRTDEWIMEVPAFCEKEELANKDIFDISREAHRLPLIREEAERLRQMASEAAEREKARLRQEAEQKERDRLAKIDAEAREKVARMEAEAKQKAEEERLRHEAEMERDRREREARIAKEQAEAEEERRRREARISKEQAEAEEARAVREREAEEEKLRVERQARENAERLRRIQAEEDEKNLRESLARKARDRKNRETAEELDSLINTLYNAERTNIWALEIDRTADKVSAFAPEIRFLLKNLGKLDKMITEVADKRRAEADAEEKRLAEKRAEEERREAERREREIRLAAAESARRAEEERREEERKRREREEAERLDAQRREQEAKLEAERREREAKYAAAEATRRAEERAREEERKRRERTEKAAQKEREDRERAQYFDSIIDRLGKERDADWVKTVDETWDDLERHSKSVKEKMQCRYKLMAMAEEAKTRKLALVMDYKIASLAESKSRDDAWLDSIISLNSLMETGFVEDCGISVRHSSAKAYMKNLEVLNELLEESEAARKKADEKAEKSRKKAEKDAKKANRRKIREEKTEAILGALRSGLAAVGKELLKYIYILIYIAEMAVVLLVVRPDNLLLWIIAALGAIAINTVRYISGEDGALYTGLTIAICVLTPILLIPNEITRTISTVIGLSLLPESFAGLPSVWKTAGRDQTDALIELIPYFVSCLTSTVGIAMTFSGDAVYITIGIGFAIMVAAAAYLTFARYILIAINGFIALSGFLSWSVGREAVFVFLMISLGLLISEFVNITVNKGRRNIVWKETIVVTTVILLINSLTFFLFEGPKDFIIDDGVLEKGYSRSETIVIPDEVTEIDDDAFNRYLYRKEYDGKFISRLVITDGVTRVGERAFEWFVGLDEIYIPKSLTEIGGEYLIFASTSETFKVYYEGTEQEFAAIKDKIRTKEGCAVTYEYSYSYSPSDFE